MTYLISLILLLLPAYLIRFSIAGVPTTTLEILIYVIFIFGLYRAQQNGFRRIPLKICLPIGLLIIALIISTYISGDRRAALGEFKGFFVDPLLVFWLVYQFIKAKDWPKIFIGLMASGIFVAIFTIGQKILHHTTADGRVIGIFGYSPNYVALYLAPITVLLIAYGLSLMAKKQYLFATICYLLSAISLLAIYFSGSRGGMLAVGTGLGVFLMVNFWRWIRQRFSSQIIVAILILMALYTAWSLFRPDFSASAGRVTTSNNLRWQIWQASMELGAKHPILGVGLGNFQNAFAKLTAERGNFPEYITPMALTSHNIFLMFWLSTGVLGLAAFIWILILFYIEAFKKLSSNATAVVLAVVTTIVAYGLVESSIWKNDLGVLFWTFLGLIWTI